jgi:membrane protease YdiL (CAAX protease family)
MDPFLIPLQLLIIGIFLFRIPIVNRLPNRFKDFPLKIANDMKSDLGTPWKTVLVPILVIMVTYLGWIFYHTTVFQTLPIYPSTDPLLLYILNSGILAPISEEILQGFFLSAMYILFISIYKNRWIINLMCFAALMMVSYIFANAHTNPTSVNWLLRFFQFMIYGALYYLYDRNLLPAIIAHSTWNLMLLILLRYN